MQVYGWLFDMSRSVGMWAKPYTARGNALVTSIREGIHAILHPILHASRIYLCLMACSEQEAMRVQVYGWPFDMSRRIGMWAKPYTARRNALVTSIREGIHAVFHPIINCLFCGQRKNHAATQLTTQTSSQMHVA